MRRPRHIRERTSFSSSGSASLIVRAAVSAACARNWWGWSADTAEKVTFARRSMTSPTLSGGTYRSWASSEWRLVVTSCQWSASAGRSSSSAATTTVASPGTRSRKERKRSTGSTSATSGRCSDSSSAAISASSRYSGPSSAAGAISTRCASASDRCVKVENQRSDSTSSPNSSTRTARSSVAG